MLTKYNISAILLITSLFFGCRKIDVPNPQDKAIFGEWRYIFSSGGFSGGQSDASFTRGMWVEYKENGQYKVYNSDGKRTDHDKFKFETRRSNRSGNYETTIVYKNKTAQTFQISGDSLFLYNQASDSYSYLFLKK